MTEMAPVPSIISSLIEQVENDIFEPGASSRRLSEERENSCGYVTYSLVLRARELGLRADAYIITNFLADQYKESPWDNLALSGHAIAVIEGIGVDLSLFQPVFFPGLDRENKFEKSVLQTGVFPLTDDSLNAYRRILGDGKEFTPKEGLTEKFSHAVPLTDEFMKEVIDRARSSRGLA